VHHHLVAPGYVKFLQENKVRDFPVKGEKECIEDMDQAGVEIALCSTIGPGFWFGNVADTKRLAREINDYTGMMIAKYPKRFGVFTTIPLPDIDGSLKEIEYGFSTLKADGVFMHTNWGNAIVYTHPKDAACCEGVLPGVGSGTVEYTMDTARTMVSLLYSGTAAKYPNIRWIFSHGGG